MLRPELSVGVLPMPDFTMLAFAAFIDTLRLAADDGDRSRPVRAQWTVMSERRQPVRASNGVMIQPAHDLQQTSGFDYVVVVGGTLHAGARETPRVIEWLHAVPSGVPLVGLCTGSFTLARAGLMDRRAACVSWFHHEDYVAEFPHLRVISDRLFLDGGDRITSAGGTSVVHVASHLVDRHLGPGTSAKGLRIMIEDRALGGAQPQPSPRPLPAATDPRVRRALLAMERRLGERVSMPELAAAAGTTARHLTRLFRAEIGQTPGQALWTLRLDRARGLLNQPGLTLAAIAADCGFADAAHLARRYRCATGRAPRDRLT